VSSELSGESRLIRSRVLHLQIGDYLAWFALRYYSIVVDRWASEARVLLVAALYVQLPSLIGLWAFRTVAIMKSPREDLLEPFKFFSLCEPPRPYSSFQFLKIIFGKYLCDRRIQYDFKSLIKQECV
jgi:hypothetical protein